MKMPKAIPSLPIRRGDAGAAGVEDLVMYAQRSSEPGKPCRLRRVDHRRGSIPRETGGCSLWAAGWRIEVQYCR
jgi:hypothetical protein